MSEPSFIYWIRSVDPSITKIKIGLSRTPARRFTQISCMSPVPLQIVGLALGEREHEKALHSKLESFRLYGEWFEEHPTVLATVVAPPRKLDEIASWMSHQAPKFPHYNLRAILRELHHLTPPFGGHHDTDPKTASPCD